MKFSSFSSINWVGGNKKFCCLNQQTNFKQHGSDNAKGAEFTKLSMLPSSSKFEKNVLIKRLNVVLNGNYFTVMLWHGHKEEIILLSFFCTLWDTFRYFIHDFCLRKVFKLTKLSIPGYYPCTKRDYSIACKRNIHDNKPSLASTVFYLTPAGKPKNELR